MPRKTATAETLTKENSALRAVGAQMALWCFLISAGRRVTSDTRARLGELARKWNDVPESAIDGRRKL